MYILYLSVGTSFDGFWSGLIRALLIILLIAVSVGIIGGLSSMILGKFVVPKANNHNLLFD